jgi:hypothetical protein
VARVNDKVVTQFELDQRIRFLEALRAPGVMRESALDALIDERLQLQAGEQLGIEITDEQILAGMEEFAQRAELTTEQFVAAITQEGVSRETFEDFVRAGLVWREVVGARFAPQATVTEAEIDALRSQHRDPRRRPRRGPRTAVPAAHRRLCLGLPRGTARRRHHRLRRRVISAMCAPAPIALTSGNPPGSAPRSRWRPGSAGPAPALLRDRRSASSRPSGRAGPDHRRPPRRRMRRLSALPVLAHPFPAPPCRAARPANAAAVIAVIARPWTW